ncbi:MAG TPA: hypothetical protein VK945_06300 [Planococcus sp. (in: firmicutes)]|nr:hypothetical protein [Planococcus sp. (in: firmicutes)]
MTEKQNRQSEDKDKEGAFTGSPEQQLPDLEAEDKKERDKEQTKGKSEADKKKES